MATDKRIIKTRQAITTAFMELSLEKDIRKITVSDIAGRASVNRSTFYLHYNDAKEVLEDIENNISKTVYECFAKFDTSDIFNSSYEMFITLTKLLDEKPAFKNFMLHSPSSGYVVANIKHTMLQNAVTTTLAKSKYIGDLNKIYISIVYMISGMIDAYIQWATNDREDKMSLEEHCKIISTLTQSVINAVA